ncbi:MAG: hypothetical protein U0353_14260 [Sandaracinus sp.]
MRANATAVALGAAGGVTFTSNVDVDVIADMSAAFAGTGLGLRTAGPLRVLDTRSIGTPLVAGVPYPIDVHAPTDARAVVASIAAIQPGTEAGFLTAFPCGASTPPTSNLNFVGSSVTANAVLSELGADGRLCVVSSVGAHLVVDVTGYLVEAGELSYQALTPVRVLDTRQDGSLYTGRLGEGQTVEIPIQTMAGMPPDARAAIVSLATLSPGTRGYLVAHPCGIAAPGTSSLNFDADDPIAALSVSALGAGSLCITSFSRTHLIVDLLGVWVPTPDAPPPTMGPGPATEDPEAMEPPPMEGEDAGVTADGAAPALDGGALPRSDAGPSASLSGTCGCRAGGRSPRGLAVIGGLLVLGWRRRARRSREV